MMATDIEMTHVDSVVLVMVAEWKRARAEAEAAWAYQDGEMAKGYECLEAPTDALRRIRNSQDNLAIFEPKTRMGANAMLGVALEILATRQAFPDRTFAEGPVIEIIRNVRAGMEDGLKDGDEEWEPRPKLREVSA